MSFYPLTDLHEAIAAANVLPMAFQASIFTENLHIALDAAERLDASAVMVDDHTAFRTDWMPWAAPVRLRHRRHSRDDAGDDPTEDDRLQDVEFFPSVCQDRYPGFVSSCGMARARRDAAMQDTFRGHSTIIS